MILLCDTALLLNDFFHRQPELAQLRGGRQPTTELEQMWAQSHEALLSISLRPNAFVCLAEYSVLRLATVLSDLRVDAAMILEELRYWNSNFRLLSLSPGEAETALERGLQLYPSPHRPAEDYILAALANRYEVEIIISPQARKNPMLAGVRFVEPAQVQKVLGERAAG